MALSRTQIANLALGVIHSDGVIEDVDTDTSEEAKRARLWFDHVRQMVLSAMDWSFAHKRLTLSSHENDPSADWGYRYQYPSDCVAEGFRRIYNPLSRTADPIPYAVEYANNGTKSILTDQQSAIGEYTTDLDDPAMYSGHFAQAFASLLGYFMAGPATGKKSIKEAAYKEYLLMLTVAGSQNYNEQQERAPRDAGWTRSDVR